MSGSLRLVATSLLVAACAASAADPGRKTAPAASGRSPEAQCLADAAAPREPKPDAPNTIVVAHVLVRHAVLERPEGATRTRGEACLRALAAREALEKGESWDDVVRKYSDEKSATQGNLGSVKRDDLEQHFADAAFALDVNELSYVVETDRGFHVIVRLE